ncbi:MAG: hypothetical protein NWE83_04470 [Candidatus Bathyarchaeota archaeon]|nr:hypothetical protein [Candidatus Bathyarchaeota archaeon]
MPKGPWDFTTMDDIFVIVDANDKPVASVLPVDNNVSQKKIASLISYAPTLYNASQVYIKLVDYLITENIGDESMRRVQKDASASLKAITELIQRGV